MGSLNTRILVVGATSVIFVAINDEYLANSWSSASSGEWILYVFALMLVLLSYHRDKIALNYRFVTFRTFQSLKEIFVEFITPSNFDRMLLLNL